VFLCLFCGRGEDVLPAHLPNNLGGVTPGVHERTRDIWCASRGMVFIFVSSFDLCIIDNSISPVPLAMPEEGDGATCPAASPDEGRWVPRPVASVRQRAQEVVRHASTLPSVGVAEAPSPKPDAASPQQKGGEDSATVWPLRGEGGTAGHEDAGGACALPPTQLKALCAMSAGAGSTREEGGANGGTVATHRPGLAPQGVNNLGEALAAICSLASFPPIPGAPAYKLWEAHLQVLSGYVQRYPAAERRDPSPLVREIGVATAPGGGAISATTCRAAAGLALACPAQPTAASPGQQRLLWRGGGLPR
jgi:hypothetical protein